MNMGGPQADVLDRIILITGASSGIGYACAQKLAAAGARHLMLTGRDASRLSEAAADLQTMGAGRVDVCVCDQSRREDLERLFDFLETRGWPDVLIANVGINPVHEYGPKKLHNLYFEQLEQAITTNITHTCYLVVQVLRQMRARRFGRLVLMGSQAWQFGIPGQALYNLSKSSLLGLKNSIVSEYGSAGVFCHLLNPGVVLNARTERLRRQPKLIEHQGVTEDQVACAVLDLLAIAEVDQNGREMCV